MIGLRRLCVAALLAGFSGPASAAVLYDNLTTAAVKGYDSAEPGHGPVADGPLGASFSTGSSAFDLSQVDILVGLTAPASTGSFMVFVAGNDVGGGVAGIDAPDLTDPPLAVLAGSVADSSISSLPQTLAYTLTSPLLLSADTRYWIVVAANTSTAVGWAYATDNNEGGSQVEDELYYSGGTTGHNSPGAQPYIMEVAGDPVSSGTSVPEPASLSIIGAGLAALGMVRRRVAAGRS